jgi:hypothetical protein
VAPDYVKLAAAVRSERNVPKCDLEWLLGALHCNEMEVSHFPIDLTEIGGERLKTAI